MKTGILTLSFTKNNVFFSLFSLKNFNCITISSGNKYVSVKGGKKVNFLSIDFLTQIIIKKSKQFNLTFLHLKFKGKHKYQRRIIFLLRKSYINIVTIYNSLEKSHNGCCLKKKKSF